MDGIKGLPVADLVKNFIKLYKKFECERAKDQKSILVSILDELMRQKEISKEHYCFLKGRIKKIYKSPAFVPWVKCVTKEIIDSDMKELHKV